MPFTLQSSGDKKFVTSQVNGQITASFDQAPKGKDREDNKARLEKIRDYLFNDLAGDFPDESPTGLVLVGDAGKDYINITNLQFSVSRPPKEAEEAEQSAPDKKPVETKGTLTVPPAPNKQPVGETTPSKVEQPAGTETNPTTASPNFTGKSPLNPTAPNTTDKGTF